jgi:alpha-ribazole phosphatase
MNDVFLIRHGMTQGNQLGRYLGRIDEPLCPQGAARLTPFPLPCQELFVSPMLRCVQTAAILFPGREAQVVEALRECDFGDFEGKTAQELSLDATYTNWVAAGCVDPIPGGESVDAFKSRCCRAFIDCLSTLKPGATAAFVVHGGVIMSILEALAHPKRSFYDYALDNGHAVRCRWSGAVLTILEGGPC